MASLSYDSDGDGGGDGHGGSGLSQVAPAPIVAVDEATAGESAHSTSTSTTTAPPPPLTPAPAAPAPAMRAAELSPPYWPAGSTRHGRAASIGSVASTVSGRPAPIRLEDNTAISSAGAGAEDTPPSSAYSSGYGNGHGVGLPKSPLWARVVRIPAHTLVAGTVRGVGDYVVWTCRVDTLDGGTIVLRKRYSEFAALREHLETTFPRSAKSLPVLPPKSVLRRFQPGFLEKRRKGLEFFLNCTLLNPEFASSAILKEFVFR